MLQRESSTLSEEGPMASDCEPIEWISRRPVLYVARVAAIALGFTSCGGFADHADTDDDPPAFLGQMAAGDNVTCGLEQATGQTFCWSDSSPGQITAGTRHACSLDGEQQPWCWGSNEGNALRRRKLPAIPAGQSHACVIDLHGKIYCWGGL
jgi:hypothetical protein